MKNFAYSIIMVCLVSLLPQCRKANVQPLQNGGEPGELIEMTLKAGNGDGGKSSIDGLAINWQVGDRMYVVDNNKGLLGHLTAAEVSSTNTTIAVFKGFITKPSAGDNCMFYFVGDDPFTLTGDNYTYDISVQYGTLNNIGASGELPGYDDGSWKGDGTNIANSLQLLKSDEAVTITDDMLANRNFGDGIIMMRSMMALSRLDLRVNNTPLGGRDNDIVTVSGAGCYATATLNTKTGALTPHLGDITLKKASGNYCMVLIPASQTEESTVGLKFTATSGEGEGRKLTAKIGRNRFYNYNTAKEVNMEGTGILNGVFSMSDDGGVTVKRYHFAQGNLQYLGNADGTGSWRFADNQWDLMGDGPASETGNQGNVAISGYTKYNYASSTAVGGGALSSDDKSSARDLIGWGCTGFKDTRPEANAWQVHYMPYSVSDIYMMESTSPAYNINRHGYGPDYYDADKYNLTVESKSDWGCLEDLPGNTGETKVWRTPTNREMTYLLNTRKVTVGGVQKTPYGEGIVHEVNGLIILPDDWDGSACPGFKYGQLNWANNIDNATWTTMEAAGAVFLPASGTRYQASVNFIKSIGAYWLSTTNKNPDAQKSERASLLWVTNAEVSSSEHNGRRYGQAVRLVREASDNSGEADDPTQEDW